MASKRSQVITPVQRQSASLYVLITILSFGLTVVAIRLFLEATGYPKIGGGTLHIAHVLWGGLAQFAGGLILIIFANRWAYVAGSCLVGCGIGLFIDEIGKFLTQDNDYFFAPAAPIIYGFFLLTIVIYLQVRPRKQHRDARVEMYHAMEGMQNVLDHDLDRSEYEQLRRSLQFVTQSTENASLRGLAESMSRFLESSDVEITGDQPNWLGHLVDRWIAIEAKYFGRQRMRLLIVAGFIIIGLGTFTELIISLATLISPEIRVMLGSLYRDLPFEAGSPRFNWLITRFALEGIAGIVLVVSGGLLLIGRDKNGIRLGALALEFMLCVTNLLAFYVSQFAVIGAALAQFIVLIAAIRYRHRFLNQTDSDRTL